MGGTRTQQQQVQQQQQNSTQSGQFNNVNTYGWEMTPDTADIAAQRGFQFQADPRIGHTFARGRSQARESFHNPLGGYTTPQLRDQILRASDEDSTQQEAQAYREENYGRQALDYARLADVAALTQPRLTQQGSSGSSTGTASGTSSGTGSSTSTQSQSPINSIIQGGSAIGSALIM